MRELTAEVVVAGAGPTGLMLANELALAGVDVVVLERLTVRTGLSKALNLQPRTAEVLDLRGLLARAKYLAGCDGGRSADRKALKLKFEGYEGRGHGVVADVLFRVPPPGAPSEWRSMHNLVTADGIGKHEQ
jgi:2-polyprenyl-6-methoxyphenol hydroxylase-like FAD-dependent oxidoreductase